MTDAFEPLYPAVEPPLAPGTSEAYDITRHLASFFADGGSLLDDQDDGENNDQETDPPPTLEQLADEYGVADDPDTWTGPTEAELPGIIAAIKRFARLSDDPAEECLACFGGTPECPSPHGDPPLIVWKQLEFASEGDDE